MTQCIPLEIKNTDKLTQQPNAQRMKVRTSSDMGAEPTALPLTRPPSSFCTRPNTSQSQMLPFVTMPLKSAMGIFGLLLFSANKIIVEHFCCWINKVQQLYVFKQQLNGVCLSYTETQSAEFLYLPLRPLFSVQFKNRSYKKLQIISSDFKQSKMA